MDNSYKDSFNKLWQCLKLGLQAAKTSGVDWNSFYDTVDGIIDDYRSTTAGAIAEALGVAILKEVERVEKENNE